MVSENYSFFRNSLLGKEIYSDGGRAINFYSSHGIIAPYANSKKWAITAPTTLLILKNNIGSYFYISKDGHEFTSALEKEIKKPFLEKINKKIQKTRKEIIKKLKSTDYKKLSEKQLSTLANEYFKAYHSLLELPASCRIIDWGVRKTIPEEILSKISLPKEISVVSKEELEILLLADKVKKKSISRITLAKEIEKIHAKHCFNSCGYFNERAKSIQDYENLVNMKSKGNPRKDYDALTKKYKTAQIEQAKIIKTLKPKEQKIAKIASLAAYLKDQGKEAYNEIINSSEPLFLEIAKRTGKNVFFIKQLYPEEVQSVIAGNQIPEQLVLQRIQKSAEIIVGTKVALITGTDVDLIEKEFFPIVAQKELKGRVASSGSAKGKACVILSEDHFDDFHKGDILVVQNTNPWHVVLMKKASAIIAEEGGLTSHVAVTSRELGIPCIVGVLNATKIIKSGDIVEVDAIKGKVSIL